MVLDKNVETFVIYIISFKLNLILIHLAQNAQIAFVVVKEIKIPTKYLHFLDVFFRKNALILSEATKLN